MNGYKRMKLSSIVVAQYCCCCIFFGESMTMNRINAVCVLTSHMQTINSGNVQCCAFHCKHYSSIIFYDDDDGGGYPFRVFLIELWIGEWEYEIKLILNRNLIIIGNSNFDSWSDDLKFKNKATTYLAL